MREKKDLENPGGLISSQQKFQKVRNKEKKW